MSTNTLIVSSQKSTNVRPHRNKLEEALYASAWPLRAALAVSPALAGRMAAKAFFTTLRPRVREEEAGALSAYDRHEVPFEGGTLPAWTLGLGPKVILTHGWSGRAAQLAPLGAALASAGLSVVIFDHPAHGEASGKMTTLPEMRDALVAVDAWTGGAQAVVAHSLGAIATTLAMRESITPRRVVYIAPPIDPERWPTSFARKLGLGPRVDPAMRRGIERIARVTVTALDPRPIAAASETPLLLVHDRDDREVPYGASEALTGLWRDSRLVTTRGLGHYRILRDPAVSEEIARWLSPLSR